MIDIVAKSDLRRTVLISAHTSRSITAESQGSNLKQVTRGRDRSRSHRQCFFLAFSPDLFGVLPYII